MLLLLLVSWLLLLRLVVIMIRIKLRLLLLLLLVMAGRRRTHFKGRGGRIPGECHLLLLLLSVPRIGHGRVMVHRLTRIGFLVVRDPLLLGCLSGRFHGGSVKSVQSGQDLLTRPFHTPFSPFHSLTTSSRSS